MSLITTIIDGIAPNPSSGLGGANEGHIQGFQDDIITGVAGGVADKAGGQCLVTQNSPLGMSVLVADGVVYVPNADYIANLVTATKFYRVVIKDEDPVTISANSSGDYRYDAIDVVIDKNTVPNEYGSNMASVVVSEGDNVEPPAVPDNGYRLAEIEVADGATQIVTAAITDSRDQIAINEVLLPSGIVTLTGTQTLTNKTLTSPKVETAILDANGNEVMKITATASAVNEPTLISGATGDSPARAATGGDTNIGLVDRVKGTGVLADDGPNNYAADAGANDTYAITINGISAYFTGQIFRFKANTANTGAATLNVNSLGAKTIVKNYNATLADGDILANQLVEVIYDGTNFQMLSPVANVSSGIITTSKYAPQGFLINGKIVPSVASDDLTVAIKGMDGNDPSASNPVYVRIGDTVRTITAALSRTLADGTNWMNLGSAELATKEVDLFPYLVWDSNSSAVGLTFARIPFACLISDFSATTTNEKYCAGYSDFTTTDECELIGRFAATLSAGAGYTWTVPTFTATNLIQRPIYTTRWLSFDPTLTPSGSMTYGTVTETCYYQIKEDAVCAIDIFLSGTVGGTPGPTIQMSLPITPRGQYTTAGALTYAAATAVYSAFGANWDANTTLSLRRYDAGNLTAGNGNFQGTIVLKMP